MSNVSRTDVEPERAALVERALRVLLVNDARADEELMLVCLKSAGYVFSFDILNSPVSFHKQLQNPGHDVTLREHDLKTWIERGALKILHEYRKNIPFIVVTGSFGDERAVHHFKNGAADHVLKHRLNLLPLAVGDVLKEKVQQDEKAQFHERILAGERDWELTFDSVPEVILILNDQCRVRRANRAAIEALGIPFTSLIGRPCYEVLHGLDHAPPNCPHEQLLTTGTPQRSDFEEPFLGKVFDMTSTPLRDSAGKFQGCIQVLRDISDRNRAEQALRHGEERYRSLVSATSQVVWSTDPDGRVVEDLPTWRKFTGQSTEETHGLGWRDAIHPDDRKRVRESWANAVMTVSSCNAEFRIRRSDGEYRDVLNRGVPVLEKDGTIREWIGTCLDITDHKQLEEKFRQAQKMEAMGRLAGGISHDFNNLLGVIIGYSDLALTSLRLDDISRHRIEEIKKAGVRATSLTRRLLAFSRKQVLKPKVLDLNIVVAETTIMLRRLLREDIELITKLDPALDHVKADPTQIEQVIMNLAINARDAMPDGGKLIIETANTQIDQRFSHQNQGEVQFGSYVLLTVSDTGIGMDSNTRARIFEPFFTTKAQGKGTGLGLATVYGIVKQSGGSVSLHSEIGKGSIFKVYIPSVTEKLGKVQPEKPAILYRGSGTILLVEDQESLRELSHRLLESLGYTVIEAANGPDAIRIAGQYAYPIRLLVTDVVMPGMSGHELAEMLVTSRSQLKVLYISGHADDVILHYSILKPGIAFLQKPFTRDGLAKKIQEVIEPSGLRESPMEHVNEDLR
jgi:PAS domain S-box-containing protein